MEGVSMTDNIKMADRFEFPLKIKDEHIVDNKNNLLEFNFFYIIYNL